MLRGIPAGNNTPFIGRSELKQRQTTKPQKRIRNQKGGCEQKKKNNKNKQEEEEEAVKGERRTIDASVGQWACVLFSLSFVCREWQAGSRQQRVFHITHITRRRWYILDGRRHAAAVAVITQGIFLFSLISPSSPAPFLRYDNSRLHGPQNATLSSPLHTFTIKREIRIS